MQRRVLVLTLLVVVLVTSAAWALQAYGAISASTAGNAGIFNRISADMTEPVGLVVIGVCLIAISVLLRRRASRKRSRNRI